MRLFSKCFILILCLLCVTLAFAACNRNNPPSERDGTFDNGNENNSTPYVGPNGNWWIGTTDTGIKAEEDSDSNHVHSFSSVWKYDEEKHWHECECGEKGDLASHLWDRGVVTKVATYFTAGEMTYTCTACGYQKREEISASEKEVRVFLDGNFQENLHTTSEKDFQLDLPEIPEDITVNTTTRKYFTGWYLDSSFQNPVTEGMSFENHSAIYGKYVTVDTADFTYVLSDGKAIITSTIRKDPEILVIPKEIESYPVVGIGSGVFQSSIKIKELYLWDGLKAIDDFAFSGCTGLKSVKIPDSMTDIGNSAFSDCSGLKNIIIPDNVTNIGSSAFSNCAKLSNIVIPDSVVNIGSFAFSGCTGLKSVTIPTGVKSIGDGAFSGCSSLESITIPFVGAEAGKTSLDMNQYPFGYIFGTSGYTGGKNVTQAYYGSSTSSTSSSTYYIPSSLRSVKVTGGNILYGAFQNCSMLTTVEIGDRVTGVGPEAFSGCDESLFDFEGGVQYVGKCALKIANTSLGNISIRPGTIVIAAKMANRSSGLKHVEIPDSVTSIGYEAFSGCTALKSVTIPASVTLIDRAAAVSVTDTYCGIFAECSSLEHIYSNSIFYPAINDCLLEASTDILIAGCKNSIIPADGSITRIDGKAFCGCIGLTDITIPNSVTSIGSSAFSGCSSLQSITIPFVGAVAGKTASDTDQYPLGYIFGTASYTEGTSVKQSCYGSSTGSTTYYIPSSLRSVTVTGGNILRDAFENCSMLTSITILDSVTSIGDFAFRNCSGLTSVTIPDSVTSIGMYAFIGCPDAIFEIIGGVKYIGKWAIVASDTSITGVTLRDGTVRIANCAFSYCSDLTSVTIPDSVTSIGGSAFSYCSGLTSVTIPDSVTSIGGSTFANCSGLKSVTIPDSVTSIGNSAFYGCSGLTSITIPDSVTSIGEWAFYRCSGLTSVTIPDSVTSIGRAAFSGCSALESITIPFVGAVAGKTSTDTYQYPFGYIFGTDSYTGVGVQQSYYGSSTSSTTFSTYYIPSSLRSVTMTGGNILYGAFENCSMLTSITIPDSVTSIGSSAFSGCKGLTNVTIPDSVTSIGGSAFANCSGLTSVTIGNGVTSIGSGAFSGCSGLTSVHYTGDIAGWCGISFGSSSSNPVYYAHHLYIDGEEVTDLVIPDRATSIKDSAFSGCSGLTNVTIPNSVTSIGNSAFYGCSSLTSVTIPDSVTSIGGSAFSYCSGLTSVTIPDSVTRIGSSAFSGCSSLTSITIPDSVTSIGERAFYGCSSLTSITIPDSVTSIGNYAFYGCSGLTGVTIPDSVTSIGEWAFGGCSGLTSVTIPDSVTSIGSAAFSGCSSLQSITIPFVGAVAGKTSTDTYQYPFGYIFGTSSYTGGTRAYGSSTSSTTSSTYYIPSSLRSVTVTGGNILYGAFYNCSMLTSVTIPDSVTSIGRYAFANCSGLKSVTIPDSVTSIGGSAFVNCSGLTSVTIPNSVTSIGDSAFYGCSGLTSVTIPDSVTSIGWGAFYGCSGLTNITIPDSVTSIGNSAFRDCIGLQSINYRGSKEKWSSVIKGNQWNDNTGNYTVVCLDGTISK